MGMRSGWFLDLRFVMRSLSRSTAYVLTAVTILGCAVAANATVFSYVRGTLLAEASYPDPEEVAIIWGSNAENGQIRDVISGPAYIDLQEGLTSTAAVALFHHDGTYFEVEGRPEVVSSLEVNADFFSVLGVEPAMGRGFGEADRFSGGEDGMVVTWGFWRDWLGSDPNVIGSSVNLEGRPRTVLGVMPEGFSFISPTPILLPLHDDVLAAQHRGFINYHGIARLRPGATMEMLNAELAGITEAMVAEYPETEGWGFRAERLDEIAVAAVRPWILILVGAVGLVLLVALSNLATLFRVRAAARTAEIQVRAALGAGRGRLARVLMMETVILAGAAVVFGLIATPWVLQSIADLVPLWITIPDSAARVPVVKAMLDGPVMAVCALSAVVGALVLTAPSLPRLLREGTSDGFHARGGAVRPLTSRLLVGTQLAVATVLCGGAALLVRSFDHLIATDDGIEAEGLLTAVFGDVWGLEPAEQVAYFRQVVEAVEGVPGVTKAGVIDYVDFRSEDDFAGITLLDRALQPRVGMREEWRRIDEGLFETAGMRMVRGVAFNTADFEGPPRVAVVNEAFAEKHYPDGDAIGGMLSTHDENYVELTIVGIVADVQSFGPTSPPPPMLYVPNQGAPRGTIGLYVRTAGAPMLLADQVRDAIWSVDSSQPVVDMEAMDALVDSWIAIPRAARALLVSLAGLTWLLSVVGVFGSTAYALRARRAEFGVRVALGASPGRLERDQLIKALPVIVLGVGTGLAATLLTSSLAQSILFGVSPTDPLSLTAAVAVTGAAALLAAWLPARGAGRQDPARVLRPD